MHRSIATMLIATLASACDLMGPSDCPLSVEPAIVVRITDARTGAPRAAGARGIVRDGEYTDSLIPSSMDGAGVMLTRQAAEERPGLYDITIEHDGYETWVRRFVWVGSGECNVNTRRIDAELMPVSSAGPQ